MCQEGALKVLERQKDWVTTKFVTEKLKIKSASTSLRKLYNQGLIMRKYQKIGNHDVSMWMVR